MSRLTLQQQSVLSLSTALDCSRLTLHLVIAHTPRLQIPQCHCGLSVTGGDERQLSGELRHRQQRRRGRLGDGEISRHAAWRSSAVGRGWSLVGLQVGEGGGPGGACRLEGGGRGGRCHLLGFAVHRGKTSFPGAETESTFG